MLQNLKKLRRKLSNFVFCARAYVCIHISAVLLIAIKKGWRNLNLLETFKQKASTSDSKQKINIVIAVQLTSDYITIICKARRFMPFSSSGSINLQSKLNVHVVFDPQINLRNHIDAFLSN